MGHAFTVCLVNDASEMKILCSEESLRKLADSLAAGQFLRVKPVVETASAHEAHEYEIFAKSGAASAEPEERATKILQAEPIGAAPAPIRQDEEFRQPGSGSLDWAANYERHKAAERKRRLVRYAVFLGLLAILPLSALLALA